VKKKILEKDFKRERTLRKDSRFDNNELVPYGNISRFDDKISIISW
jgi:hypothetical protein